MLLACYAPPRRKGASSDTAIRPSVCPSIGYSTLAACRSCLGYRHAGCPAAGRPPEVCGLRTRPRTDVDPPRVELPSAGGISSRRLRGDNLFTGSIHLFMLLRSFDFSLYVAQ